MKEFDVIIIGGGISGLTAANYLINNDLSIKLFESEDEIGGRVRSFNQDGFTLDRGFQVFLPAYPEAKKLLDYKELDLKYFLNGAYIIGHGSPFYLVDPLQKPKFLLSTILESRIGLIDKLKLFFLRMRLNRISLKVIFQRASNSTRDELRKRRYSINLIRDFFQPFLSGIFLEKNLDTQSSMFDFVVKMFNEEGAALPAKGISAISKQLSSNLGDSIIETKQRVKEVKDGIVTMESGDVYKAKAIIWALEGNNPLLDSIAPSRNKDFVQVRNFYYSLDKSPVEENILILNADEKSVINNLCFVSKIAPDYAPKGKDLVSITVLENENIKEEEVRKELTKIFGEEASSWNFLKEFNIPYALPSQKKVSDTRVENEIRISKSNYLAGDFNLYGSLNAAMQSGREAAELVLSDMKS